MNRRHGQTQKKGVAQPDIMLAARWRSSRRRQGVLRCPRHARCQARRRPGPDEVGAVDPVADDPARTGNVPHQRLHAARHTWKIRSTEQILRRRMRQNGFCDQ